MVVYTLEQLWEILRHYSQNHGNVAERVRILISCTDFGRREANWKETGILIDKPKREKPKTAYTREYCCCSRKCGWSTINIQFQRHHWDEFCIKTLVWRHTKFNWFRNWSQLTIQCVFASLTRSAIESQKMPILAKKKNHLFRWSLFWSWRVCKQAKLSHLGHRKPTRIHWKAEAPKNESLCGSDFSPKA